MNWLSTARERVARSVHDPILQSRLQVGTGVALGIGLILSAALIAGILGSPQARLSDLFYQPIPASGQVALVTVDDKSLQEMGPLPWSRSRYAELVNALNRVQPRGIAFDVVLADQAPDDPVLLNAFSGASTLVQPVVAVDATRFPLIANQLFQYDAALFPGSDLRTATTILAHTTVLADSDGVVRRIPLGITVAGRTYLALGMALLDSSNQQPVALHLESGYVKWGDRRLPVDEHANLLLGFADPARRKEISASDVLAGRADVGQLRDKFVLVGVTASSAPMRYNTPLRFQGRGTSAIDIQADLIETLLRRSPPIGQDRLSAITMIMLMALLAGATLPHVRLLSAAGMTILYFVAYLGYAFQEFSNGLIVEPLYPTLALLLTFVATTTYRYLTEDRERAHVERLFRRHATSETLAGVLEQFDRGLLQLRGARRLATVLYIDLRDFAPQNESLAAEAAIKLLSNLMAEIANIVFRHGGLMIRQQGSVVVASWNTPIDQPQHAQAAARAASEVRVLVQELNSELEREIAVGVGMGIATGTVLAGRVGVAGFAEFTLVGEPIQVAEHLAQRRDGTIFIDAATRERLDDQEFILDRVSKMRLRRKTDPLEVWEIQQPLELEPLTEDEMTRETF